MIGLRTAAAVGTVLVMLWWAIAYYRARDAGEATGNVAETFFGVFVGGFAAVMAIVSQGGAALSAIGDQLGAAAPWLGQLLTAIWGWVALKHLSGIKPGVWLVVALAIMVGVVMFVRDG